MVGLSQLPNLLSTGRLFCVPYVLFCPIEWRFLLLIVVALSDFFDGYLARKWNVTSKFGTLMDPLGDKGIALAFAYLFWSEGAVSIPQLVIFFSREWALVLFVLYAFCLGKWQQCTIRSFWCGKIATTLQGIIVAYLCLGSSVPAFFYGLLLLSGVAALPELMYRIFRKKALNPLFLEFEQNVPHNQTTSPFG
jgi:CDP-diacylglycerol--glycerol-3-phosphate 3-phosphatidyltransferase